MKSITSHSTRLRRVAQASGALLLAGIVAVVYGAQKNESAIHLKRDDAPVPRGQTDPASYADVVGRVSPSVVEITVETKARRMKMDQNALPGMGDPFFRQFFGGNMPQMEQPPTKGLGSGVIISPDGYIVTNNHVVDGADSVTVVLSDGRNYPAKVVGRDPQTDVAVVKVDATGLPAITFADSSKIKVGDRVLAVGNPFGIGETVTSGIVSALGRHIGILDDVKGYEDFIQTDAAINPGNSGGALVDVDGRLIGMNTAILSRSGGFQGVGLAVPADMVSHVAESIVRTGKVEHGFIGVNIQNITPDLQETFGLKDRKGALVADVVADSPASRAGLRDGDVITSVDGRAVADANGLSLAMSEENPGRKIDLNVIRAGKDLTVAVTTGERPGSGATLASARGSADDTGVLNGVAVDDINRDTRQQFNIPEQIRGALVVNVDPDSAASRSGISAGDVILSINRHPVTSAQQAVDLSAKPSENGRTLVRLWSRGATLYVVVDEPHSAKSAS